jgi:hypothetical protein
METWRDSSAMKLMVIKLKKLKEVVIVWQKEKRKNLQEDLLTIEKNLEEVFLRCPSQIFSTEEKDLIF